MDDGYTVGVEILSQFLYQKFQTGALLWCGFISPVCDLIMCDHPDSIFLMIFQFDLPDEDILKLRMNFIFDQSNSKFLLLKHIVVIFAFRKIPITFDLTFFYQFAQHVNRLYLILFNHSPEVGNRYGQGTLSGNNFFLLDFYHICVDVVLDSIFWCQFDSGWFESHVSRMPIQRKLFWMFVQFINMLLGLSHEGQQFKLGVCTTIDTFQLKIYLFYRCTHFFQILVLGHPLEGNVIIVHFLCYLNTRLFLTDLMQRIGDRGRGCGCREANYAGGMWMASRCPFAMGNVDEFRREGREIMVAIYCGCGREVGEICFAGRQHLGMWRMTQVVTDKNAFENIEHWLGNNYGGEVGEVEEGLLELKKTVVRITKGLKESDLL